MNITKRLPLIVLIVLGFAQAIFAEGPEKGQLTVKGKGAISSIDVKYDISQLMGEPIITAAYRWHSTKLKVIKGETKLWIKVQALEGTNSAYIEASPTVPDQGEWGFDTAGSPNWDAVLIKSVRDGKVSEYFPAKTAKRFWKAGFTVVDAQLSIIYN